MTSVTAGRATQPLVDTTTVPAEVDVPSAWRINAFGAVVVATVAGYVGYVIAFGVNVVFWDDWAWAGYAANPWKLSFASLWVQHNENIIFFPNLVAAILIPLTHWNSVVFMSLSAAMLIGVLGITIYVLWGEIIRSPLLWLPLPFIVLSLAQYQDTLWAYQIAWFMILLALFGALAILIRPNLTPALLIGAALLGIIGSYSSFQGLLIWPAGLVVLLSKGQAGRWRILWCAIGAIVAVGYFANFNWAQDQSAPLSYILSHLTQDVQGVLITAGSVIPTMTSGLGAISSPVIAEIFGAILLGLGLSVIAMWIRRGRASGAPAFCVALIVTSILFDLSLIPSWLVFDPATGATSRYDSFMWPMLLGIYAYAAMHIHWPLRARRWLVVPLAVLVFAVASAVVLGTIVGVNQGRTTRTVRMTAADVLANMSSATIAVAAPICSPLAATRRLTARCFGPMPISLRCIA